MGKNTKEYITVSIHVKIEGELHKMKEVRYQRGKETFAFTLDDFARIIFFWEKIYGSGCTYAMDGFLQKAEKKLPKKEGETAQSVFEKYWVNRKKTMEAEFAERNKGDKDDKYPIFPEEDDYLTFQIIELCRSINDSPMPIKHGFMYWFYKYLMDENISQIEKDIKEIPDFIKKLVDTKIVKQEGVEENI